MLSILGVRIDNYTEEEALNRVEKLMDNGGSHYIVTPNPEIVLQARRNPAYKNILNASSLSLCDGTGLYLAGIVLKQRPKQRICGIDFMSALCGLARNKNWLVALVGASTRIRTGVLQNLAAQYPGLRLVAVENEWDDAINADIALVALGAPKQEQWMASQKTLGRIRIMMGVGGAFDVLTHALPRAPRFMRNIGLEWLWRLAIQPKRLGRIFNATVVFPIYVCIELLASRGQRFMGRNH